MKYLQLMLMSLGLLASANAREPVALGDWGRITLPETYQLNVPFQVKVEVLHVAAPTQLVLSANWKKQNDGFGGFLQYFKATAITEPGTHEFNLTIRKDQPDLKSALLSVYLSPDGAWNNHTLSGIAELPKAAAPNNMDKLAEKSERTQKAEPFSSQNSPMLPSLKEAGLAEVPEFEDTFEPGWPLRDKAWEVATWRQNGTQMSPERAAVNEDGQLVLTVKAGAPFQGGSLQSNREFGFGRWVARVKASAEPGVLNSIFTKDWNNLKTTDSNSDGNKGEVDIELLSHTFGPNRGEVHLAIHLKNHTPLWHLDIPLDFNPSDDYHEWGFDILPDRVVWHVDGRVLHTWKYTDEHFITPDYEFFFNAWTMEKWIKGPPASDAKYHIDWVRFYPLLEE